MERSDIILKQKWTPVLGIFDNKMKFNHMDLLISKFADIEEDLSEEWTQVMKIILIKLKVYIIID